MGIGDTYMGIGDPYIGVYNPDMCICNQNMGLGNVATWLINPCVWISNMNKRKIKINPEIINANTRKFTIQLKLSDMVTWIIIIKSCKNKNDTEIYNTNILNTIEKTVKYNKLFIRFIMF